MKIYTASKGDLYTLDRNGDRKAVDAFCTNPCGDCGFGVIEYCGSSYLRMGNTNSASGDVSPIAAHIVNGAWVFGTEEAIKLSIKTYAANPFVSATGVTLSGCTDNDVVAPLQLTAIVLPSGALQTGTWTSSDTDVAVVNAEGLVTPVDGDDDVTITFTSTDGGFTASCILAIQ